MSSAPIFSAGFFAVPAEITMARSSASVKLSGPARRSLPPGWCHLSSVLDVFGVAILQASRRNHNTISPNHSNRVSVKRANSQAARAPRLGLQSNLTSGAEPKAICLRLLESDRLDVWQRSWQTPRQISCRRSARLKLCATRLVLAKDARYIKMQLRPFSARDRKMPVSSL